MYVCVKRVWCVCVGGAWSHLENFPYVLCQQFSFGVDESRSSITKFSGLESGRLILKWE